MEKTKINRGRPQVHDWDRWLRPGRHVLLRGRDYGCSQSTMSGQLRGHCSDAGLSVSIEDGDDRLTVTVKRKRRTA